MSAALPLVIIGSGLAGYSLLRALRRDGAERPVTVLTRDDGAAYFRADFPAALAAGRAARDLVVARADHMAHRLSARIVTHTTVQALDRASRRVLTDTGEHEYAQLVIATGADPLRPNTLRGSACGQLLTIANLAEYSYFSGAIAGRKRIVVLGGDIAACELAGQLRIAGFDATLFEDAGRLMPGRMPVLCARFVQRALVAAGVRILLENGLQRMDQGRDELNLTTLAGDTLLADVVVAACGTRPRVALAHAAGLGVGPERGITVDARLNTSDAAVFALGECAEFEGRLFALPDDIEQSAAVLAGVLAGKPLRMRWQPRVRELRFPGCPALLCEPPVVAGEWQERADARGVSAQFVDQHGGLRGFVLLGEAVAARERLLARLVTS